jgi:hypothetical protein
VERLFLSGTQTPGYQGAFIVDTLTFCTVCNSRVFLCLFDMFVHLGFIAYFFFLISYIEVSYCAFRYRFLIIAV